jgi:hypothetical protein
MAILDEKLVGREVEKMVEHRFIFSAVLCVENLDGSMSVNAAAGEMAGGFFYKKYDVKLRYLKI